VAQIEIAPSGGGASTARVIGSGVARASGLKKGAIVDIQSAAQAIQLAVNDACNFAGVSPKRALVSVSGAYIYSVPSVGRANIPMKEIEPKDINRVMRLAVDQVAPSPEYEILHILPYEFKVDEQANVQDPVGMHGSRLEAQVNVVIAQKPAMENLRRAIAAAGVEVENFVLSSYAASIAVLNDDERELGSCVIDIGASTCDMAIFQGNAPRYCDFFAVGGGHITSDLSISLHTPLRAAENIKIEHGSLLRRGEGYLDIPQMGNESASRNAALDTIANVINARVEETLLYLSSMLTKSQLRHAIGAGVVFTGGAAKLEGIAEIASPIFGNMPVRVARCKQIAGMSDSMRDPAYAVALGLVRYGAGEWTPYEIDSTNNLREGFRKRAKQAEAALPEEEEEAEVAQTQLTVPDAKFQEPTPFNRLWNWLRNMF
jgi:cell division protein FtsA